MTTVALFGAFRTSPEAVIAAIPEDYIVVVRDDSELPLARDAEVALGGSNRDRVRALLAVAPHIRWYHTVTAGVDSILAEFRERSIVLTNNSGSYDVPIAEHVMMFLLASSSHLQVYLDQQRRREWKTFERRQLRGSVLVIYGLGSIGSEIARLAGQMGMRVIGVRRRAEPVPGVEGVVTPERLSEVASLADYLVVAAPLTEATRGAISREVIGRMKPTAWLVNVARGPIVDEIALVEALRKKQIGGAALDVFAHEPLPQDSPLWTLDNVIMTPHTAGDSEQVRERTLALFAENLRRFKVGEPLLNQVDLALGY